MNSDNPQVQLWEDTSLNTYGELYLVINTPGCGYRIRGGPGEFFADAADCANKSKPFALDVVNSWTDRLVSNEAGTHLVATWTPGRVFRHRVGGVAARRYLGDMSDDQDRVEYLDTAATSLHAQAAQLSDLAASVSRTASGAAGNLSALLHDRLQLTITVDLLRKDVARLAAELHTARQELHRRQQHASQPTAEHDQLVAEVHDLREQLDEAHKATDRMEQDNLDLIHERDTSQR